jgi:hypothetical protein
VRGSLPATIEGAIAPYLVRPNDPKSIYSLPVVTKLNSVKALGTTPPPVGCALDATGQPDWRPFDSDHFVIWSCGGGVGGADPYEANRVAVGAVAEDVWTAMAALGQPRPDDYVAGPASQSRIDIYILEPNQCRVRSGKCTPIPKGVLAAAAPASPCNRASGGPLTSSVYLVIGAAQAPATAPGPSEPSEFRYLMTHEFFHAISFGLNFEAQGGVCTATGADLSGDESSSWLTEASAEWASFAFFPDDDHARRPELFRRYQLLRDSGSDGLHETRGSLPYEAFLYPLFVQEENGGKPAKMLDFWSTSQGARNRVDLDDHLNTSFAFADHFRDFAVRNLNRALPGGPVVAPHATYDAQLLYGAPLGAFVPEPSLELQAPLTLHLPLQIAPLAAETEHYFLNDRVRSLRVDVSSVPNSEHLSLDAVVKVGKSWKRERLSGPVYEFCRDDDPSKDISELYLVFSNFDRQRSGQVKGDYEITTRAFCPGGWSGSIHARQTLDESSDEVQPAGRTVIERHTRDDQRWSVVGTTLYLPPGYPKGYENERLDMHWSAEYSVDSLNTFTDKNCGTTVSTDNGSGTGSDKTLFDTFAVGPGKYSLTPSQTGHEFTISLSSVTNKCEGVSISSPHDQTISEGIAYLITIPELTGLTEDPKDPGHFAGKSTFLHDVQARPGGQQVIDITVDWDLRRVPLR